MAFRLFFKNNNLDMHSSQGLETERILSGFELVAVGGISYWKGIVHYPRSAGRSRIYEVACHFLYSLATLKCALGEDYRANAYSRPVLQLE